MKLNISQLLYEDNESNYDLEIVNYEYLEKTTPKKIDNRDFKYHRYAKVSWIKCSIMDSQAEIFLGKNISFLYRSIKKLNKSEHKRYIFSIKTLVDWHIDRTNKKGEIVNNRGYILKYRSEFYTDENNIIRKYDYNNKKRYQHKKLTKLELIAEEYWRLQTDIDNKKIGDLQMGLTNAEINRRLKEDKEKLKTIESDYWTLHNFIYKRDVRDKADKNIKPKQIKPTVSKVNVKSKRINKKIIHIKADKVRLNNNIFPSLK